LILYKIGGRRRDYDGIWWNDADREKSELPGKESASFQVCFVKEDELKIHIFPL
jgi:hypothetical protein